MWQSCLRAIRGDRMRRLLRHGWPVLAIIGCVGLTAYAFAIIEAPLPLEAIVNDSEFIAVSKVEKVDVAAPLVVLAVHEDLKGKAPFRRLAVHFKGDDDAKKLDHVPQLLKRLGPDLPVILFVSKRDKNY